MSIIEQLSKNIINILIEKAKTDPDGIYSGTPRDDFCNLLSIESEHIDIAIDFLEGKGYIETKRPIGEDDYMIYITSYGFSILKVDSYLKHRKRPN